MQKILRNGSVLTYSTVKPPCIAQIQRRCVSRNTAIHRGLRQGVAAAYEDRSERPWEKRTRTWERANRTEEQPGPWEKPRIENPRTWEKRPYQREHDDHGRAHIRRQESDSQSGDGEPRSYRKHEEDSPLGFNNPETTSRPSNGRKRRVERTPRPPAKSRSYDEPVSIPYTTAASEFLYGYNPVCAALKAQRRKLYKIYLHPRVASRDGDAEVASIRRLAEKAKVEIVDVNDGWLKVMDKMSDDRPHNVRANTIHHGYRN
jgi:hypothetical protein